MKPSPIGLSSPSAITSSIGDTAGLITTSSPTATCVTFAPTPSTTPATSQPGTWGSGGFGMPRVTHRSMWLSALATDGDAHLVGPGLGQLHLTPAVGTGRLVEDPCVHARLLGHRHRPQQAPLPGAGARLSEEAPPPATTSPLATIASAETTRPV